MSAEPRRPRAGSVQLLRADPRGDPYDRFLETVPEIRVPMLMSGYPGGPSVETVRNLREVIERNGTGARLKIFRLLGTRGRLLKRATLDTLRLISAELTEIVGSAGILAGLACPGIDSLDALPPLTGWPTPRWRVGRALPQSFRPDPRSIRIWRTP